MSNSNKIRLICSAIALVSAVSVEPAYAQLEEIVVTARKKVEDLQSVPIAISAMSGESMQAQGMPNLEAVAPSIPNFHHAEAVISSDIFIVRGVGTAGSNVGFEQAVGQVLNGFFYGRSRFGRASFLDVERLEVLKGPQGALIGKNTSAGAINITSKKPTDEFEGYLLGAYDFEASKGYSLEGAFSGSLTDSLNGRLAFRKDDRDGWLYNNNTGEDEQSRDDTTVRAILDWDISDRASAEFFFQTGDSERIGRNREWSQCSSTNEALILAADPNADCNFDGVRSTVFVFDDEVIDEAHNTDFSVYGVTVDVDFDSFALTSLTNYTEMDAFDIWDIDQSIVQRTNTIWEESYEQFSQEFRIASTQGEKADYIAGVYYQSNDLDFSGPFAFHRGPSSGYRNNVATQEQETKAIFAQVDWYLSQDWTLTLGGRYTDETKDAVTTSWYSENYNPDVVLLAPGVTAPGYAGATAVFPGNPSAGFATLTQGPTIGDNSLVGSRSETDFSPNASLQWDFAVDQMLYLNAAKGFKGGGFDLMNVMPTTATSSAADGWQFEEESTTHLELGGKHTLADNTLRLNWALFNTEFEDMQVTALDGIRLIQVTTNAASATTSGLEADIQWAPTDALNLALMVAHTNAEFDSFANAPCYAGQTPAEGCNPGPGGGSVQDLAGHALPYSVENQFTVNADYSLFLDNGMELIFAAQYYWVDDSVLQLDADPANSQESYGKVNGRISLHSADGSWELSLVGRNLTDEMTTGFSNDTLALSGGPAAAGTHFKFLQETRAIGLQARWNL